MTHNRRPTLPTRFGSSVFLLILLLGIGCAQPETAFSDSSQGAASDSLTFRYFGAAGWEISAASKGSSDSVVVLIDPYLTRAKYGGPAGRDPNDDRPNYTRADTLFSDTDLIDTLIRRADYILVHHTHPDHVMDVP